MVRINLVQGFASIINNCTNPPIHMYLLLVMKKYYAATQLNRVTGDWSTCFNVYLKNNCTDLKSYLRPWKHSLL